MRGFCHVWGSVVYDASDPECLISTAEAAELAGVSAAVVRQWASRGILPRVGKAGRTTYYRLLDVAKAEHATRTRTRIVVHTQGPASA